MNMGKPLRGLWKWPLVQISLLTGKMRRLKIDGRGPVEDLSDRFRGLTVGSGVALHQAR